MLIQFPKYLDSIVPYYIRSFHLGKPFRNAYVGLYMHVYYKNYCTIKHTCTIEWAE